MRSFREESGNAGITGREMPPVEVLASMQHVEDRARALRDAGMPGTWEELKVRATLDLLQERDSRQTPAGPSASDGEDSHASGPDPDAPGDPGPRPGGSGPGGPGLYEAGQLAQLKRDLEYVMTSVPWPNFKNPKTNAVAEEFRKRSSGKTFDTNSGYSYDGMFLIADFLERAKSTDPDAIVVQVVPQQVEVVAPVVPTEGGEPEIIGKVKGEEEGEEEEKK